MPCVTCLAGRSSSASCQEPPSPTGDTTYSYSLPNHTTKTSKEGTYTVAMCTYSIIRDIVEIILYQNSYFALNRSNGRRIINTIPRLTFLNFIHFSFSCLPSLTLYYYYILAPADCWLLWEQLTQSFLPAAVKSTALELMATSSSPLTLDSTVSALVAIGDDFLALVTLFHCRLDNRLDTLLNHLLKLEIDASYLSLVIF